MTLPVIPEYIVEVAKKLGDEYMAYKNGIGDASTPGSALFDLANLQSLLQISTPAFGAIINSDSSQPFQVTYDQINNPSYVQVSSGQVGYNGQIITIQPQSIPILQSYSLTFSSVAQYGIIIGLPYSECQLAQQVYSTTVTQTASIGSNQLYVANISEFVSLGFPLRAYVGSTFLIFSGVSSDCSALLVDAVFNNQLPTTVLAGSQVNFVYQPQLSALYGLPVSSPFTEINNNPANFDYYPFCPNDWLPIAKVLVEIPYVASSSSSGGSGSSSNYSGTPIVPLIASSTNRAILSTLVTYPMPSFSQPVFSPSDAQNFIAALGAAQENFNTVLNNASIIEGINALSIYTNTISGGSNSFRQYWATQPFTPSSSYGVGVDFNGYERVTFSNSFAQAYYDFTGQDLVRTFALFSGTLYNNTNVFASGTPSIPSSPSYAPQNNSLLATGVPSTLVKGTYIYGISSVSTVGESLPVTASFVTGVLSNYYVNILYWLPPSTGFPVYYNIYRYSTTAGDQSQFLLTTPGEVSSPTYSWTQYPTTLTGGSSSSGGSSSPLLSQVVLSSSGFAASSFVASESTGLATGNIHLGGVQLELFASAPLSNPFSDVISVSLYSDNGGTPGTLLVNGTSIAYNTLIPYSTQSAPLKYISQMDAQLVIGNTYWIVLQWSATPVLITYNTDGTVTTTSETIQIARYTTSNNDFVTSSDGSTWTIDSSYGGAWIQPLGFIDNGRSFNTYGTSGLVSTSRGSRLTGDIALTPTQLYVVVPGINSAQLPPPPAATANLPNSSTISLTSNGVETPVTKNDMVVTVVARNGANGVPVTLTATVPQFSGSGSRQQLIPQNSSQTVFDRIESISVVPGANLALLANNSIYWSPYDFITVETAL